MIRRILRDERGEVRVAARPPIAAPTLRKDAWWALPVTVVVVLLSFIIYSTWAAFQNAYYYAPPYLSPFYSPCISVSCLHSTFGYGLTDIQLPIIGLVSPAFLILWGPGLFRLTCYYYRKAYYRSFWLAPAACAVPHPDGRPRVRDGHRHDRDVDQRHLPGRLHVLVPLLPPRVRRARRRLLARPRALQPLALHHAPERAASHLRLALAVQRGTDRPLHPPRGHGHH